MPYESFKCSHRLSIRGLVQDMQTGSWRYLIQVQRNMDDSTASSALDESLYQHHHNARNLHQPQRHHHDRMNKSSSASELGGTTGTTASHQRPRRASTAGASSTTLNRPCTSQVYSIRRSFAEFKLLHAAVRPFMGKALPDLPMDNLLAMFFVGETQNMLQKKRLVLESMLKAIEAHAVASDSSEYLEFLANTNAYEEFRLFPRSPAMSRTSLKRAESSSGYTDKDDDEDSLEPALRAFALRQHQRRCSIEGVAPRENHIEFHRHSLS